MQFPRSFLWMIFLPIVFGCEENSPTKSSEKWTPAVKDLVGTYQLMHVKYEATNITITDQTPGFSILGSMWIHQDSTMQQTITMNGETENYLDKIVKIHNDSVMTLAHGSYQYQIKYKFDRINLNLIFEEIDDQLGPVRLTEEWKRISLAVRKSQPVESGDPLKPIMKLKRFLKK